MMDSRETRGANRRKLTAMDTDARKAVVNYFDNMLIRFDDG
jgi:hypothetical protein